MIMSAAKIVLGTLGAFAAGTAVGMLYAPNKGSATRKELLKESSRRMDSIRKNASEKVDAIEEAYKGAKSATADLTRNIKGAVDALAGSEPEKRARRA
jgi:gas vesicle protein